MKKPIRILLTGAGGPAAIGLLAFFPADDIEWFVADMDPYAAGLYLVPPDHRALVPAGKDPNFVQAILHLATTQHIDIIWPTVDDELVPIAENASLFAEQNIELCMQSLSTLETCLDKWSLWESLHDVVPLPRTIRFGENLDVFGSDEKVIVKPRFGSGGRGIEIHSLSALQTDYAYDDTRLIQHLLPGMEYSVDVFVDKKGVLRAAVPRTRNKVDSGIAVAGHSLIHIELQELTIKICDVISLRGIANIQFKLDADGTPNLLEINPRVPGTLALSIASGPNMAHAYINDICDVPSETLSPMQPTAMVRTWQNHIVPIQEFGSIPSWDSYK